jgi:hypothetical protein
MQRALAAPSRQILVGDSTSPSPSDDVSQLLRDSPLLDASDVFGVSSSMEHLIGGLYGMDQQQQQQHRAATGERPHTATSVLSEPREYDLDESTNALLEDSLISPKAGATETEQWLRSLKG